MQNTENQLTKNPLDLTFFISEQISFVYHPRLSGTHCMKSLSANLQFVTTCETLCQRTCHFSETMSFPPARPTLIVMCISSYEEEKASKQQHTLAVTSLFSIRCKDPYIQYTLQRELSCICRKTSRKRHLTITQEDTFYLENNQMVRKVFLH